MIKKGNFCHVFPEMTLEQQLKRLIDVPTYVFMNQAFEKHFICFFSGIGDPKMVSPLCFLPIPQRMIMQRHLVCDLDEHPGTKRCRIVQVRKMGFLVKVSKVFFHSIKQLPLAGALSSSRGA